MLKKIASVVSLGVVAVAMAAGPAFAKLPTRVAALTDGTQPGQTTTVRGNALVHWNGHKWAGKVRVERNHDLAPGSYVYVVQMTNHDGSNAADAICTFKIFRADKAGGCAGKSTSLLPGGVFGDLANVAEVYPVSGSSPVMAGDFVTPAA